MKKMAKTIGIGVAGILVAGACLAQGPQGGFAVAPGGHKGGQGPGPDIMLEKILQNPALVEEIGLSEEQVAKLKDGAFAMKKEQIRMGAELKLAALEQAELVQNRESAASDIMAAVEKTGQIRTEIAKLHMRHLLMVREVLTPEQQEKVHAMVRKHMHMKKRGHAPAGMRGDRRNEGRLRGRRPARAPGAEDGPRPDDRGPGAPPPLEPGE